MGVSEGLAVPSFTNPILITASASADASGDESAAKYSEMSATLGVLSNIWPQ